MIGLVLVLADKIGAPNTADDSASPEVIN